MFGSVYGWANSQDLDSGSMERIHLIQLMTYHSTLPPPPVFGSLFPSSQTLISIVRRALPKKTLAYAPWKSWKQCETVVLPCRILQSPRLAGCVCTKQRSFYSDGAEVKCPRVNAALDQIACRMMRPELPLPDPYPFCGWWGADESSRYRSEAGLQTCSFFIWALLVNCLKNSQEKRGLKCLISFL